MQIMRIQGLPTLWFPPLTFYREDGSIDFDRTDEMLARVYPYSQGVLVPGSTGDGWILDQAQQEEIVRHYLKGFPFGRFHIMIGALKPTPEETISAMNRWCEIIREEAGIEEITPAMDKVGVTAFVVCARNGENSAEKQLKDLSKILDLGLPAAFYQLPQVTGVTVQPEVILDLADKYPNLIFAKDSGGGDELSLSRLLKDRLMLMRGAEGDPSEFIGGEDPVYDGLLLSTANCFPQVYADMLQGKKRDFAPYGEIIDKVFSAASKDPVSNAFSDANRAMEHVLYYGKSSLNVPLPVGIGGKRLRRELVELAEEVMN